MNYNINDITAADMERGYTRDGGRRVVRCLFCGAEYEEGVVYPVGERLLLAERAMEQHIIDAHESVFAALLAQGRKWTGLTETQSGYLRRFYAGQTDRDIADATGASATTVRYQRHSFRVKARQAKVTLALASLLEQREQREDTPQSAAGTPAHYMTEDTEARRVLDTFFLSLSPLKLRQFTPKAKKQGIILCRIAQEFERGGEYSEKQINEQLKGVFDDYVTLRRYLVEYGYLQRTTDGSTYWRTEK